MVTQAEADAIHQAYMEAQRTGVPIPISQDQSINQSTVRVPTLSPDPANASKSQLYAESIAYSQYYGGTADSIMNRRLESIPVSQRYLDIQSQYAIQHNAIINSGGAQYNLYPTGSGQYAYSSGEPFTPSVSTTYQQLVNANDPLGATYIGRGATPMFSPQPGSATQRFAYDEFGRVLRGGNFTPAFNNTGIPVNSKMGNGAYEYLGEYRYSSGEVVSRFYEKNVGSFVDFGKMGVFGPKMVGVRSGGSPGSIGATNLPTTNETPFTAPAQMGFLEKLNYDVGGFLGIRAAGLEQSTTVFPGTQSSSMAKNTVTTTSTTTTTNKDPWGWVPFMKEYGQLEKGASGFLQGLLPAGTKRGFELGTTIYGEMAKSAPATPFLGMAVGSAEALGFIEAPVRGAVSLGLGVLGGTAFKGLESAYAGSRAIAAEKIISQGGKWRFAEQATNLVMTSGPKILGAAYGIDVAARSTSGFSNFNPVSVMQKAAPIATFEALPMGVGFGMGYQAPGAAYRAGKIAEINYKSALQEGRTTGPFDYFLGQPVRTPISKVKIDYLSFQQEGRGGMSDYFGYKAKLPILETTTRISTGFERMRNPEGFKLGEPKITTAKTQNIYSPAFDQGRITSTKVVGGRTVPALNKEPSLKKMGIVETSQPGGSGFSGGIGQRMDYRNQPRGSMKPFTKMAGQIGIMSEPLPKIEGMPEVRVEPGKGTASPISAFGIPQFSLSIPRTSQQERQKGLVSFTEPELLFRQDSERRQDTMFATVPLSGFMQFQAPRSIQGVSLGQQIVEEQRQRQFTDIMQRTRQKPDIDQITRQMSRQITDRVQRERQRTDFTNIQITDPVTTIRQRTDETTTTRQRNDQIITPGQRTTSWNEEYIIERPPPILMGGGWLPGGGGSSQGGPMGLSRWKRENPVPTLPYLAAAGSVFGRGKKRKKGKRGLGNPFGGGPF